MTASQHHGTLSRPARLIDRPWSPPSQILTKKDVFSKQSNKEVLYGGQHSLQNINYLSGVRENPQRKSYLGNMSGRTSQATQYRYSQKPNKPPMRAMKSLPPMAKFDMILKPKRKEKFDHLTNTMHNQPVLKTHTEAPKELIRLNNSDNSYIIQRIPTNDSALNDGNGFVTIISSPNDLFKLQSGSPPKDTWDEKFDPNVCRTIMGLTKNQLKLCHKHKAVMGAAAIGIKMAVNECQHQMKNHRWNCSSLENFSNNPHSSNIMETGYSESGFGHAIVSAGITHSISRACAAGRLNECSCGKVGAKHQWKWSGCHDNTRYGAKFSRKFLDSKEEEEGLLDLVSYTHLHNNELGRKLVRRNRSVQCKCHGMSGSCEVRTCWKAAPDFRRVGDLLRKKYKKAQIIQRQNKRSSLKRKIQKPDTKAITPQSPLLFVSKSPSFCERNQYLEHPGTQGRQCNSTGNRADSCRKLCCGRGHKVYERNVVGRCNCHFKWCCKVTCQDCIVNEIITICN